MVSRPGIGFLLLLVALIAAGCDGNRYGGYTKTEAKAQARYAFNQIAKAQDQQYAAMGLGPAPPPRSYKIIGAEHATVPTGSSGWFITFRNDAVDDQVCVNVWRNAETGDRGRWQEADC